MRFNAKCNITMFPKNKEDWNHFDKGSKRQLIHLTMFIWASSTEQTSFLVSSVAIIETINKVAKGTINNVIKPQKDVKRISVTPHFFFSVLYLVPYKKILCSTISIYFGQMYKVKTGRVTPPFLQSFVFFQTAPCKKQSHLGQLYNTHRNISCTLHENTFFLDNVQS